MARWAEHQIASTTAPRTAPGVRSGRTSSRRARSPLAEATRTGTGARPGATGKATSPVPVLGPSPPSCLVTTPPRLRAGRLAAPVPVVSAGLDLHGAAVA